MNYLTAAFWNCLSDYIKKSKCWENGVNIIAYTTNNPFEGEGIKIVVETKPNKYYMSISMREMGSEIEKIVASEECDREDAIQFLCDEVIRKLRKIVTFAYVAIV